VLYHPEAIALAVSPGDDLTPLLEAVQAATRAATGDDGVLAHQPWTPHLTVAYSSARQPAAPIIAAVGRELPPCDMVIRAVSLVDQDGPEDLWNWEAIGRVPLGAAIASARREDGPPHDPPGSA
jgi:2'-5' RNA ligase